MMSTRTGTSDCAMSDWAAKSPDGPAPHDGDAPFWDHVRWRA